MAGAEGDDGERPSALANAWGSLVSGFGESTSKLARAVLGSANHQALEFVSNELRPLLEAEAGGASGVSLLASVNLLQRHNDKVPAFVPQGEVSWGKLAHFCVGEADSPTPLLPLSCFRCCLWCHCSRFSVRRTTFCAMQTVHMAGKVLCCLMS